MNKHVLRRVLATFFAFAAALLLALGVCAGVLWGVFSAPCVTAIVTRTTYVEQAEAEIIESLEHYAIPSGLPADFFADGLPEGQLHRDMLTAIDCAFTNRDFTPTAFEEALRARVMAYAQQFDHTAQETTEDSIEMLVEYCSDAYTTFSYSTLLRYIGKAGSLLRSFAPYLAAVCLALSVGLLYLLMRVGQEHTGYYIGSALSGAGLLLVVFPTVVLSSGGIARLVISSPSLFTLSSTLLYVLLWSLVAVGVLLILAVVLVSAVRALRTARKQS